MVAVALLGLPTGSLLLLIRPFRSGEYLELLFGTYLHAPGIIDATFAGDRGQAFNSHFVQGERADEINLLFGRAALDERGAKVTGACNANAGTLENVTIATLYCRTQLVMLLTYSSKLVCSAETSHHRQNSACFIT